VQRIFTGAALPPGADSVRESFSARDLATSSFEAVDATRQVFFDDARLQTNLGDVTLANADFSDNGGADPVSWFEVEAPFQGSGQGPLGWRSAGLADGDWITTSVPAEVPDHGGRPLRITDLPRQYSDYAERGHLRIEHCLPLENSPDNWFNFGVWGRSEQGPDAEGQTRLGLRLSYHNSLDECLYPAEDGAATGISLTAGEDFRYAGYIPPTNFSLQISNESWARVVLEPFRTGDGEHTAWIAAVPMWKPTTPSISRSGESNVPVNSNIFLNSLPSSGTRIHYTTDGSDPTLDSPAVDAGSSFRITLDDADDSDRVTVKAMAVRDGWENSEINTGVIHVREGQTRSEDSRRYSCSLGTGGFDPMAPLLLLLAMAGLIVRRRMG
jgi:hypothetical protein